MHSLVWYNTIPNAAAHLNLLNILNGLGEYRSYYGKDGCGKVAEKCTELHQYLISKISTIMWKKKYIFVFGFASRLRTSEKTISIVGYYK